MSDFSTDLPDVAGGWAEQAISVGDKTVRLALPADPDAVLDDAVTLEQNQIDDYMPYWCWLWPAAIKMAQVVDRLPIAAGLRGLELGCGLGLVGTTALMAGLDVVMSDYRDEPVRTAKYNAALNGFRQATTRKVNWREEPRQSYDYLIACDVLYEANEHHPILDFIGAAIKAGGECWIGDPGRAHSGDFVRLSRTRFDVSLLTLELEPLQRVPLNQFFLIRLSSPGS
jgi:predicted nicotinamide N-methyase